MFTVQATGKKKYFDTVSVTSSLASTRGLLYQPKTTAFNLCGKPGDQFPLVIMVGCPNMASFVLGCEALNPIAEKQKKKHGCSKKTYEVSNILKHSSCQERQGFTITKDRCKDGSRREKKCFRISYFSEIYQNNAAGRGHETADN